MRAFVALNFPASVRSGIAAGTAGLREAGLPVRWVDERQLHLTLKFIGEVAEERVAELSRAVARVASGGSPMTLRVGGFGAFPSVRSPRVLWMGVERSDGLVEMKTELEEAMAELGVEREERDFHPHLTLGRTRRRFSSEERSLLTREAAGVDFHTEWRVETVDLMRSRLGREGARYSVVGAHPLGGTTTVPGGEAGGPGDQPPRPEDQ